MDILKERPADMSFTDYRLQLKSQKVWIKNHKRGKFYYIASEVLYSPEDTNKLFGFVKTYPPFIGTQGNY